jgi:hypothetical protein
MKRATIVLALALLVAGCDARRPGPVEPTPEAPEPGWLTLSWSTPHGSDGAVLLALTGPDLSAVQSAGAHTLHQRLGGDTLRVTLFGDLGSGPLLSFFTEDTRRPERYRAVLLEVSDAANALRASLSGYALTIAE